VKKTKKSVPVAQVLPESNASVLLVLVGTVTGVGLAIALALVLAVSLSGGRTSDEELDQARYDLRAARVRVEEIEAEQAAKVKAAEPPPGRFAGLSRWLVGQTLLDAAKKAGSVQEEKASGWLFAQAARHMTEQAAKAKAGW
jgi:hypothetical protein